jgi:hypothetical protein
MVKFVNEVVFGVEVLYIWRKFILQCKVIKPKTYSQEIFHAHTS